VLLEPGAERHSRWTGRPWHKVDAANLDNLEGSIPKAPLIFQYMIRTGPQIIPKTVGD
jgi:hypothetical protein